jgi:hypothetical protein
MISSSVSGHRLRSVSIGRSGLYKHVEWGTVGIDTGADGNPPERAMACRGPSDSCEYATSVEYRIDPTTLTRRRGRRVLAVTATVAIGIGVIVGGLALEGRPPAGNGASGGAVAAASTISPAPSAALATPAVTPSDIPIPALASGPPPELTCHDVPEVRCAAIARAVLLAVADPALPRPTTVDVWASLLCGSDADCPPGRLLDRRPAGSAVVLAGSTWLWVNVSDTAGASGPGTLSAWVIRSGPLS